jgi:uncharacterized repeat protein (TIGR03847 family)
MAMPRRRYLFDPPSDSSAGTVGEPGDRTSSCRARDGARVVSVVLEKVQVADPRGTGCWRALAVRAGASAASSRPGEVSAAPTKRTRTSRRATTAERRFRAGSLTLGWDGDAERVLVEARATDDDVRADSIPREDDGR